MYTLHIGSASVKNSNSLTQINLEIGDAAPWRKKHYRFMKWD